MKILFLTPQLPYPPRQGTQIRNYYMLKEAAIVHQVDLLSFARPGEGIQEPGLSQPRLLEEAYRDPRGGILEICRKVELLPVPHRSRTSRLQTLFTSPEPDMASRLASKDFDSALRSLLETCNYEIVQVEGLEMARYIPTIAAASPGTPIIFDDHNVEYLLQLRAAAVDVRRIKSLPKASYSAIQSLRLKQYERRVCQSAKVVLAVSDLDAKALRELGVTSAIAVVPNCIDVEYYHRAPDAARDPATLLFTGTMDYRPNVDAVRWFASEVLPRITAHKPHAQLQIVGRSPDASVVELARRHPAVRVVGGVDDIRPYFFHSTVCVVPIRMAGGARLKILEALASELPVVATRMGAEGVDCTDGKGLLLADTADDFAAAVLRLLEDQDLQRQLAAAGRQVVENNYDWRQVAPRLLAVYDAVRGTDVTGRRGERGGGEFPPPMGDTKSPLPEGDD